MSYNTSTLYIHGKGLVFVFYFLNPMKSNLIAITHLTCITISYHWKWEVYEKLLFPSYCYVIRMAVNYYQVDAIKDQLQFRNSFFIVFQFYKQVFRNKWIKTGNTQITTLSELFWLQIDCFSSLNIHIGVINYNYLLPSLKYLVLIIPNVGQNKKCNLSYYNSDWL